MPTKTSQSRTTTRKKIIYLHRSNSNQYRRKQRGHLRRRLGLVRLAYFENGEHTTCKTDTRLRQERGKGKEVDQLGMGRGNKRSEG
jgi:hypothetical protein